MVPIYKLTTGFLFLVDHSDQHPAATRALKSAINYLHYHNIFQYPFIYIKWFFVKLFYGLANWAGQFMNKMLNTASFVNQLNGNGKIASMLNNARSVAAMLMIACLIWVAIKVVVNHEPPRIKNVLVQVAIGAFLITNLGTLTTWLTDQSVQIAKGFLGDRTTDMQKDQTSSLPFKILKAESNDVEYLIDSNFAGTGVSPTNSTSAASPKEKWGYNDLTQSSVDQGTTNFYKIIDWNDVDDNMPLSNKDGDWKKDDKNGTHFLYGWLKYHADNVPASKKDKVQGTKWISPDIPRWGGTGDSSSFSWGGYPRYDVDWLPCILSLAVLFLAYVFAAYVMVKAFLDIVMMNIIGLFLTATDLSAGKKTKQVVGELFSSILLISLQAFELAFYEAVCTWGVNALKGNPWGFAVFMLAASMMVITGSEKVASFFGVDTGAQRGMRATGSVLYAGRQLARGAAAGAAIAGAPGRALEAAKRKRDKVGRAFNTKGSMRRDARAQARNGARQNAVDQMAGYDRNGNRTVDDFMKGAAAGGAASGLIHQTKEAQKSSVGAYRKAARATRQADIRQRRKDELANAAALYGLHEASGTDRAFGTQDKPNARATASHKETKPMSRGEFNQVMNQTPRMNPNQTGENSVNRSSAANGSGLVGGQTPMDQFHNWQKRASQYDKQNGLNNTSKAVNYNPLTGSPYTYDEYHNNVNDVMSNDVPKENLDGTNSGLSASDYQVPTNEGEDRTVEDYQAMKNNPPESSTGNSSASKRPAAKSASADYTSRQQVVPHQAANRTSNRPVNSASDQVLNKTNPNSSSTGGNILKNTNPNNSGNDSSNDDSTPTKAGR